MSYPLCLRGPYKDKSSSELKINVICTERQR